MNEEQKNRMKLCRYYKGEKENPYIFDESVTKMVMWDAEYCFVSYGSCKTSRENFNKSGLSSLIGESINIDYASAIWKYFLHFYGINRAKEAKKVFIEEMKKQSPTNSTPVNEVNNQEHHRFTKKDIMKLMKYYKGEKECPYDRDDDRSYFWHGEMMFIHTRQDVYGWETEARMTRQKIDEEKKQYVKDLNDKQFGIVLYIETLTGKWDPYKDLSFIFKY